MPSYFFSLLRRLILPTWIVLLVFRCFDSDADNYIGFDEFVKGMSVFLKGKFEDKLRFCFRVYDLNGDRYIVKEEMFQMLKNCLVKVRSVPPSFSQIRWL